MGFQAICVSLLEGEGFLLIFPMQNIGVGILGENFIHYGKLVMQSIYQFISS